MIVHVIITVAHSMEKISYTFSYLFFKYKPASG